ncbi:MAG: tetratricopeptide repeat protein, partial [Ktedonobacterales bacterium]
FPLWLTLTAGGGALALVGVVYALAELVGHDDWAGGARTAGFVAIGAAFVAAVALVIRLIGGRRAGSAMLLGVLLVVALAALGGGGVGLSAPLHSAQAHSQESAGQWTAAIGESGQAGEAAPNAPNIARVYDEWGERLLSGQSFKDALSKFSTVTSQYEQSGAPVARANSDTFQTYSAWVKANASDTPYADALSFFQSYGSSAGCDAGCQTSAQAVEAQAHYQYGQQYLAQQDYADAIAQFETIASQFARSGYAAQAHSAAAQALLSYGQQLKSSACSNALPIYQKLVSQYSDTSQGQQAKTALAAPVSVSGQFFTNAASGPVQTVIFAKTVDRNTGYQSNDYQTSVNGSGQYTFASVAQGTYNVLYMSGGNLFVVTHASDGSFYTVTVGQLCSPAAVTIRFG